MKVAFGLLFGVISVLGSVRVAAAVPAREEHYICDATHQLMVRRTPTSATVEFIGKAYKLRREHSEIGIKYLAPAAALIIDGSSAVFVGEDRLGNNCIASESIDS